MNRLFSKLHIRSHKPKPQIVTYQYPDASLLGVPNEILFEILGALEYPIREFHSLARVCRRFNEMVTPLLYENVVLLARESSAKYISEDARHRLQKLDETLGSKRQFVQHFGLQLPDSPSTELVKTSHRPSLAQALVGFLEKMPDHSLKSFVWDTDLMCPENIFHKVQRSQCKSIETIFIRPEYFESWNPWTNVFNSSLNVVDEWLILSTLETHFPNLESFSCGRLDEHHHGGILEYDPSQERQLLASEESKTLSYPSLKLLSFDLSRTLKRLFQAKCLDGIQQLPNLTALYARDNSHIMKLLYNFDPVIPIRLTILHIDMCAGPVLSRFLLAFQGLVDLDIYLSLDEKYYIPAAPIVNHNKTLRRLGLYMKAGNLRVAEPLPEQLMYELGRSLPDLEELCAPLLAMGKYDPFARDRFPGFKFLWIINMSPDPAHLDSEPEYWWIPSSGDGHKTEKNWPGIGSDLCERDKYLPRKLVAVAIAHIPRTNTGYIDTNRFKPVENRLYELSSQGKMLTWKTISLPDLVEKYPSLLSPFMSTIDLPISKTYRHRPVKDIFSGQKRQTVHIENLTLQRIQVP
ncbi:hypothetical protein H072_5447 [Dactylellina haptotyla CBS 200.50]|uniref:F-box domain-containing protein n=1 Tax=Dactylellina haptotyla (strain CBS 200.50) TaxID=1284197 RepID=S8BMD2_DACHA|nr:hypothetical protein H072_5447 [Dactylellina haptotyla CBS 200.50]